MRIRTIHNTAELDSIKDAWITFETHPNGPTVFQNWDWNRIWCSRVLAFNPRMRLAVKLVEDSAGRPKAILPFFEQAIAGPALHVTQFLCHRMSPTYDVLLADPLNMDLAAEVTEILCSNQRGCSFIHLRQLVDDSAFTRQLIDRGIAEPQCQRAWISAEQDFSDPLKRVSKNRRKKIRRAERKLREQGTVEFRVCRGRDFTPAFDELIALHHKRFEQKQKQTILTGSNVDFLREATENLCTEGKAEVIQLRHNDVTIAAQIQIIDRDQLYALQAGFDPHFAEYIPMWLLDVESIRRGFTELGCTRYELGAIYDENKFSWNPTLGTNYFANFGGGNSLSRIAERIHRYQFRKGATYIPGP